MCPRPLAGYKFRGERVLSGLFGFLKNLPGFAPRLSDEERATLLANSPYEVSQYHAQCMSMAIYFVLDTRLADDGGQLPPSNMVKELMGEVGPKGQARAENWVIENLLREEKKELLKAR